MDFNNISFEMPKNRSAAIKVIGVGGGGSNAVNYMFEQGITGVDFIVCNTDAQALEKSSVPVRVQLGANITSGLGAGSNPEVGEKAALETLEDLKSILDSNTKMIFITAGMGGGTGTGAAPIIAKCAKEMGILTVGICTAPFSFEGRKRAEQAKEGIDKLRQSVDSLIIINNDKLRELYGNVGYKTGFAKADEVLATAAKGIAEVITHEYSINIDLHDAKTVLADSGTAIMGSAKANGEDKAKKAIEMALDSPLLNDNKITGAKNVLLLIVSGEDEVTMDEIGVINDYIQSEAGNNANIIMGMGEDPELGDNISVTIVATGFPQHQQMLDNEKPNTIVHQLEDSFDEKEENNPLPLKKDLKVNELLIDKPENLEKETEDNDFFDFKVYDKETGESIKNTEQESNDEKLTYDLFSQEDKEKNSQLPISTHSEENISGGITKFNLDDDFDDTDDNPSINQDINNELNYETESKRTEEVEVKSIPKKEIKTPIYQDIEEEEEITFDSPISSNLDEKIKERRKRLEKYNYKFHQSLKDTLEADTTPAYKRRGITLSEHSHKKPSNYIVEENNNNEIKIRPNNFLHDNAD